VHDGEDDPGVQQVATERLTTQPGELLVVRVDAGAGRVARGVLVLRPDLDVLGHFWLLAALRVAFLARLVARSLRRISPAVSRTAEVPPPNAPRTGARGRYTGAPAASPSWWPASGMSIPGISSCPEGAGVASGMSIPGISPCAAGEGAGEVTDMSIPAMTDDLGLVAIRIAPQTALATARITVKITIRRVPVLLVMGCLSRSRNLRVQVCSSLSAAPTAIPPGSSMKVP
jgi:hypothetical protein